MKSQKRQGRFAGPADLCEFILLKDLLPKDRLIPLVGETTAMDGLEVYLFEAVHPELTPEVEEDVRKWGGVATRNGGFVVRGEDFSQVRRP